MTTSGDRIDSSVCMLDNSLMDLAMWVTSVDCYSPETGMTKFVNGTYSKVICSMFSLSSDDWWSFCIYGYCSLSCDVSESSLLSLICCCSFGASEFGYRIVAMRVIVC